MAQRASLRDQTPLAVEKRRSNRTVYLLRSGARAAWEPAQIPGSMAEGAVVRNTGPWRSGGAGRTASS
jgi:hypothetical protein